MAGLASSSGTRTALITGAARGIGFASAKLLAEQGYALALADIDKAGVIRAAKDLQGTAVGYPCDVSKKAEVDSLVSYVMDCFGSLDILVANAGYYRPEPFLHMSEDTFDDALSFNLKSTFLCGQAAARQMVKQNNADPHRTGAIINLSSMAAEQAIADGAGYNTAKAGVSSLTRCMAIALAPHRIRVNAVAPGSIDTEMTRELLQDLRIDRNTMEARWLSRIPMGRLGKASEVANVVAFLASDASSYMTGQTVPVEGGLLALNFLMPAKDQSS